MNKQPTQSLNNPPELRENLEKALPQANQFGRRIFHEETTGTPHSYELEELLQSCETHIIDEQLPSTPPTFLSAIITNVLEDQPGHTEDKCIGKDIQLYLSEKSPPGKNLEYMSLMMAYYNQQMGGMRAVIKDDDDSKKQQENSENITPKIDHPKKNTIAIVDRLVMPKYRALGIGNFLHEVIEAYTQEKADTTKTPQTCQVQELAQPDVLAWYLSKGYSLPPEFQNYVTEIMNLISEVITLIEKPERIQSENKKLNNLISIDRSTEFAAKKIAVAEIYEKIATGTHPKDLEETETDLVKDFIRTTKVTQSLLTENAHLIPWQYLDKKKYDFEEILEKFENQPWLGLQALAKMPEEKNIKKLLDSINLPKDSDLIKFADRLKKTQEKLTKQGFKASQNTTHNLCFGENLWVYPENQPHPHRTWENLRETRLMYVEKEFTPKESEKNEQATIQKETRQDIGQIMKDLKHMKDLPESISIIGDFPMPKTGSPGPSSLDTIIENQENIIEITTNITSPILVIVEIAIVNSKTNQVIYAERPWGNQPVLYERIQTSIAKEKLGSEKNQAWHVKINLIEASEPDLA